MQPPFQPPGQPPFQAPAPAPFQPPAPPPSPPTPPPVPRDVSVMDGLRFTTSGTSGWTNILYCALLYLSTQIIPVIGLIVMQGYFAEVHRRLVLRHPEPYVRFDFSDVSSYLSRGIVPFVLSLLVALPFVLVMALFIVAGAVGVHFLSGAGLDEELLLFAGFGAGTLFFVPFSVLWLVLSNAAVTRAELMGDIQKAMRLSAVWSYAGKTWKRVLITAILLSFVSTGLLLLGVLACGVGIFAALSIAMIAQLHVRWQIYNEYLSRGGEPIELAPWEVLPSEAPKAPVYAAPSPYGR